MDRFTHRANLSIALVIFFSASTTFAGVATFRGIGFFAGGHSSNANGISADGLVVIGDATPPAGMLPTFRWTEPNGLASLGPLNVNEMFPVNAFGVSADGSVVVGRATDTTFQNFKPYRWDSVNGTTILPGSSFSRATAVSADGQVVVGYGSPPSGREAFRWTQATGLQWLGLLPGDYIESEALAISANGEVIVGFSNGDGSGGLPLEAFRWTPATGMIGLGHFPNSQPVTRATATSADGSVIVGNAAVSTRVEAFRWTSATGLVALGELPGGSNQTEPRAVSGDGNVIVGQTLGPSGLESFIWTEDFQMRSLEDLLSTDHGIDLTGWRLTDATGISADGRTIAGFGTNPSGQTEGWIATLPELDICSCDGDVNGDGLRNGNDVQAFVDCLHSAAADCNCAELDDIPGLDANDIPPFVAALLTGVACP